jgi:hypothetical protein
VRRLSVDIQSGNVGARAIAEAIAANHDTSLVDLTGFDLTLFRDVLGVSEEFQNNDAILAYMHAQRTMQQRVKSARGGYR